MTEHDFPHDEARLLIDRALDEDLDDGTDVTTLATIPAEQQSVARLVARAAPQHAQRRGRGVARLGALRVPHRVGARTLRVEQAEQP